MGHTAVSISGLNPSIKWFLLNGELALENLVVTIVVEAWLFDVVRPFGQGVRTD